MPTSPVLSSSSLLLHTNTNNNNNNCAADNNNQKNKKRNADDAESETASSSASPSSSGRSVSSVVVVKKPESLRSSSTNHHHQHNISDSDKDSVLSGQNNNNKQCSNNSKMVAQEVCDSAAMDAALAIGGSVVMGQCSSPDNGQQQLDTSAYETAEELKYGPGIVQKLRSRFMSYTMRLNAAKNQRPSLQNMRRATSLNNLLDDDEEEVSTRTASPVHSAAGGVHKKGVNVHEEETGLITHRHSMGTTNGFGQRDVVSSNGASGDQCDGLKKYQNEMMRSRQLRRGNDSLKRARSVETLRYDSKAWERDVQMTTNNNHNLMEVIMNYEGQEKTTTSPPKDVNMEERIVKAREKGDPRPTRLKPTIDVTERPPPDLVKTTLMKFEATANRRGRAPTSRNGEVAAKVASYKSILEKPAILYPKPPLSPKKPTIRPRTSIQPLSPVSGLTKQQQSMRSPSPLLINVDMSYKQSTPANGQELNRRSSNLMSSPPQTPPDLINSIGGVRKGGPEITTPQHTTQHHLHLQQQLRETNYESPITQLTNKLKCMQLQSPALNSGGGNARLIDSNGGGMVVGGGHLRSSLVGVDSGTSNSSASTATSSATSSPVPHSAASGSYYLNGGAAASAHPGRLELGDVSAEDCYEYRDYDQEVEEEEEECQEQQEEKNVRGGKVVVLHQFESTVDEDDDQTIEEGDEEEDLDEDNVDNVRRINKVDLQNIGQAGTTQEFRFGGSANNSTTNGGSGKPYLPVVPPRTGARNKTPEQSQKMRFVSSGGVGGVVGVTATNTEHHLSGKMKLKNGHNNNNSGVQELVLGDGGPNETDVDEVCPSTTTALLIKQIKEDQAARKCPPRDSNQVTNGSGVVTSGNNHSSLSNSNNGNGHTNHSNHSVRNGNSDNTTTTNTSRQREIEKNLINVGKSELKEQAPQPPTQSSVVAVAQPIVAAAAPTVVASAVPTRKKSWQEEPQTNTMVFNFSKRKEVPDYIESDGLILLPHRKRELPKVT